ncbi:MAG TPA: bifunctional pyr operon transcriptional regulator/uracil phosphoribosyltransferase, partial [Trueperaceae bacterium]|nr:bifunctional pyr operon transcriptional regulator/uracil phosphoribosyltransferase [Trueperaceae bacterium]
MKLKSRLMSEQDMSRALRRIAHEIIERNRGAQGLALVGIHTRGVPIAERLAGLVEEFEGVTPEVGKL